MSTNSFLPSAFNQFVIEQKVIGFFDQPVTLKSGKKSRWYVNWRTVSEDCFLLNQLSDFVLAYVNDLTMRKLLPQVDTYFGVPEGASKLGIILQHKWASKSSHYGPGSHVVAMGRGKPKEHGVAKDRYFLGLPRGKTVVIEDVTTTGGSLLSTLAQLRESEVDVVAAIGLTNRMERRIDGQSVEEAIRKAIGIPYFALSKATELLPLLKASVSPEIFKEVEREFEIDGIEPLRS